MRDWLRSWWVGFTLLPFGWLGWAAFVYAGMRARKPLWLGLGVFYFLVASAGIVLLEPDTKDDWVDNLGGVLTFGGWAATFVHALVIRRPYLDRMDTVADPKLAAARKRLERRELASELARDDPEEARELGIGRPDLGDAFSGELVDLNHAPPDVLVTLPGFDRELAERVVRIRGEINGFESVDDLSAFTELTAHQVDRLRDATVCLPRD